MKLAVVRVRGSKCYSRFWTLVSRRGAKVLGLPVPFKGSSK